MTRPSSRDVPCKIDGCSHRARQRGRCKKHYRLWRKENPEPQRQWEPENRKTLPVNPFRSTWDSRRRELCPEWRALKAFAEGVSPKPEGHYSLCRIRADEPYGPDNFVWREQIRKKPGESRKAYLKRLREGMLVRHPNFERRRDLMRKYGITNDQFKEMHETQNGVCAICFQQEMRINHKTGDYRNLAIDHCHDTNLVRGLLCWECNVTLGRVGDSIERLEAMIAYVKKHKPKPDLKIVASN